MSQLTTHRLSTNSWLSADWGVDQVSAEYRWRWKSRVSVCPLRGVGDTWILLLFHALAIFFWNMYVRDLFSMLYAISISLNRHDFGSCVYVHKWFWCKYAWRIFFQNHQPSSNIKWTTPYIFHYSISFTFITFDILLDSISLQCLDKAFQFLQSFFKLTQYHNIDM